MVVGCTFYVHIYICHGLINSKFERTVMQYAMHSFGQFKRLSQFMPEFICTHLRLHSSKIAANQKILQKQTYQILLSA